MNSSGIGIGEKIPGLGIGRIVHFVPGNPPQRADDPTVPQMAPAQAAMIVRVWNDQGMVNLSVFPDGSNDSQPLRLVNEKMNYWATSVEYSAEPKPHSWHWPAKQ